MNINRARVIRSAQRRLLSLTSIMERVEVRKYEISIKFLSFANYLCLLKLLTSTLFLYLELVSLKSFLICPIFISTVLGTNSLDRADTAETADC